MRYFRIKIGYGNGEFISIDEMEIEKAYAVFLTDGKGVFQNGVIRGQDIIGIYEDWNKAMGYNPEHKLDAFDRSDIRNRGVEKMYKGFLAKVSTKVAYLIENKQQHLIGKNVDVPELSNSKNNVVVEGSKKIADKFNVNKRHNENT